MSDAEQPEPGLPAQALASLPRPASGWSPVSNRILVRISGPGTDKFLQGQFSQHLDEVVPGFSPRAAAATPKGRAYCLTRMVRAGDDVLIDLDADLAEAILWHGGEAERAREAFRTLAPDDRAALLAFLRSL